METAWGLSGTQWDALAALATLLAAIAAVVAIAQARRNQNEADRPYVLATFEPSEASPTLVNLLIQNFGRTEARNVVVTFDPPFKRATPDPYPLPKEIHFAFLGPTQAVRGYLDSFLERKQLEDANEIKRNQALAAGASTEHIVDLPSQFQIGVAYEDFRGKRRQHSYNIDLDQTRRLLYVRVRGTHDLVTEVEKIRIFLESARRELSSSGRSRTSWRGTSLWRWWMRKRLTRAGRPDLAAFYPRNRT